MTNANTHIRFSNNRTYCSTAQQSLFQWSRPKTVFLLRSVIDSPDYNDTDIRLYESPIHVTVRTVIVNKKYRSKLWKIESNSNDFLYLCRLFFTTCCISEAIGAYITQSFRTLIYIDSVEVQF